MTRFIKDTPFGVTEEIGELYGKNLFAYCGNNPVNQTDANGQWWDWISNIAKTVATVTLTVYDKHTNRRSGDPEKGDARRNPRNDAKKGSPLSKFKGRIHSKR